jgi:antitoxin component YwqK of YwqJK toxin-antitoxin module
MIKHITFKENQVTTAATIEKQEALREKVAAYVNNEIGAHNVVDINDLFLPEEGLLAITVWYRQSELVDKDEKLLPEEQSAELLTQRVNQVKRDPIDLLADERMVRGHG